MSYSCKSLLISFLLFLLVSFFVGVSTASSEIGSPSLMPVNPEFEPFLQKPPDRLNMKTKEGYYTGYIPSPIPPEVHKPHLYPQSFKFFSPLLGADPNASSYDLRDPYGDGSLSFLTPVRNQGSCGTCWAFAANADLENYLKYTYDINDTTNNYSENHMAYDHGFNLGPCDGGNIEMAIAYWARHSGPVSEVDDPYPPGGSLDGYCEDCKPVRYVDHVNIMPVRANTGDNQYIKEAVAAGNALFTSMYWSGTFYDSTNKTYYYNGSVASNHAVVIVGWDDDKQTSAPDPGAFIVRNSWGENWGEDGYFYISYYDTSIAFSSLAYTVDHDDNDLMFERIHQYDPLGATSAMGYGNTSAWGANVFIPEKDESIIAVGIYTMAAFTEYDIYIYEILHYNPLQFGDLIGSQSGIKEFSGYHTIPLDLPVNVSLGQGFAVAVKFDTSTVNYIYPIPMERPFSNYSSGATANPGESYISSNGSSWADITDYYIDTNVCIKAFVKDTSIPVAKYPKMLSWNGNLVAGFGDNGLWYHNGTSWNWMTNRGNVGQMVVWDGKLVVDFGADHGLHYYDGSSWTWMSNKADVALMLSWHDGTTEKLVADFGEGRRMYTYDGTWRWFNNKDAVADMVIWDNKLVVDFGKGRSVFYHNGSSWTWMTNKDDVAIMLPWHDGTSERLVVDFGAGRRLYTYDGSWHWLNNKDDVNAMTIWNNKLVVDFGNGRAMFNYDGSWHWMTNKDDITRFVPWHDGSAEKLAVDFGKGRGLHYYDGSWNWMRNVSDVPEMLAWGERIVVDFGSGIGIYNYDGTWNWMRNWSTMD